MSELPPTGPAAVPPGNWLIEGLSTAEARWILPGQLDAAVAVWFGRFPGRMESREDAYLSHPVLRGLSVKIRAGGALDVKQYRGSPGIIDAAGHARGRIESWRKWSFPFGALGPDGGGPPGWRVVHKKRRTSRFRLVRGRLMADITEQAAEPACAVELSEIRSGGETWWSLGFEATGPADLLCSTLQDTAVLMFAQAPPGVVKLEMSHCQSYAEWLSRPLLTAGLDARLVSRRQWVHPMKGLPGRRLHRRFRAHLLRLWGQSPFQRHRGHLPGRRPGQPAIGTGSGQFYLLSTASTFPAPWSSW